jgi:alpha-tubulin suppressor-like RCC1 family protein
MHIQQPSSSPNGPKEYKRSREKQKMPTGSNSVLPQEVSDMFPGDTVIQLSCGSFHSLLLTSAGEVFSWGSNGSGQLGHPQTSELVRFIGRFNFSWPYI